MTVVKFVPRVFWGRVAQLILILVIPAVMWTGATLYHAGLSFWVGLFVLVMIAPVMFQVIIWICIVNDNIKGVK